MNCAFTAYSAGTVSFCSGKALMGRRSLASSSVVGMTVRAWRRQSEGTLPFPFDPEGVDVMVLEAKARSNVTVRSPCRAKVVSRLQADRSSGFLSLTRASCSSVFRGASRVEKTREAKRALYRGSQTREVRLSDSRESL